MIDPLLTYLNDHLMGAKFAIELMERMRDAKPLTVGNFLGTQLSGSNPITFFCFNCLGCPSS
jgi:hypothetical protein